MLAPKRKLLVLALLAVMAPMSLAGIASLGTLIQPPVTTVFGQIDVTSSVYTVGSLFLYTYQLDNPNNSSQVASWFSVAVAPNVNIVSVGFDTGANVPAIWSPIGNPLISVDALFIDPIQPGETSTVLYYLSTNGPARQTASVGSTGNVITNTVIAPIPEPATMAMLGLGIVFCLRRHK